jgi:hypothetical protein
MTQVQRIAPSFVAAKTRARTAYRVCCGDPQLLVIGDWVWSETLQYVADLQYPVHGEAMLARAAILLF